MTPSLEERVLHARRLLTLIHVAAATDPDHVAVDEDELLDAISVVAGEANAALSALKGAPGEVGNWTPKGGE